MESRFSVFICAVKCENELQKMNMAIIENSGGVLMSAAFEQFMNEISINIQIKTELYVFER